MPGKTKIPKTNPTPAQVMAARKRAGLSRREMSKLMFGPDSTRTIQNWETGARECSLSQFVLLLLMTRQVTPDDAILAAIARLQK